MWAIFEKFPNFLIAVIKSDLSPSAIPGGGDMIQRAASNSTLVV
jgi:hypothetical protein